MSLVDEYDFGIRPDTALGCPLKHIGEVVIAVCMFELSVSPYKYIEFSPSPRPVGYVVNLSGIRECVACIIENVQVEIAVGTLLVVLR